MKIYSVQQVEAAINWWSARTQASADGISLGREVRKLAEPYTELIMAKAEQIGEERLSQECVELLDEALAGIGL